MKATVRLSRGHLFPAFLSVALSLACGASGGQGDRFPAPGAASADETEGHVQELAALEARTLGALAAVDPRLAARMHVVPSEAELAHAAMGAIVEGDEHVALVKGATDLFSFDVRARRIGEQSGTFAKSIPLAEVAGAESPLDRPHLEWELLQRLVAEEGVRVEEERRLPRSASELVRGVVATWTPPASMAEVKERDAWLTRRLDEVSDSLGTESLRAVEATALEDALDPLERLADPLGFPGAQASLARLRIALGQLHASGAHADGWTRLGRSLVAHIGLTAEPGPTRAMLLELEASLRTESEARLSRATEAEGRAARETAESLILGQAACGNPPRSRVRSFAPPPERAPVCAALRSLANPANGVVALAAVLALHDDVTLAIWAALINGDDLDPDRTSNAHRLLATVPPDREARLLRTVATRPLLPLAVALMAKLISAKGPEERTARAIRWLAFGDAPLDVVARELGF